MAENSYDKAVAIAIDNLRIVFVTGGSIGINNRYNYATIKYSNDGVELWLQRLSLFGNYSDIAYDIAIDNWGNVIVTGTGGSLDSASFAPDYDRGTVRPTLPSWCYRDPRSVIVHIIALRNHDLHGLSPNDTTAEEHLASAGDVFQLYAGKRVPDDYDFSAMRVRMLAAATRLVDRLAANVPVRDATNAEAVFATRNGDGGECLLPQVSSRGLDEHDIEDRRWPTDTRAA